MDCQVQGLDRSGNKRPPQKSTMKGLDLGKNVFNSPSIDGRCMYGMCTRGQRVKIPRLGSLTYLCSFPPTRLVELSEL